MAPSAYVVPATQAGPQGLFIVLLPPAPPSDAPPVDELPPSELPAVPTMLLPAVPGLVPALREPEPELLSLRSRGPSTPPPQPTASPNSSPTLMTKLVACDFMRIHEW